MYIENKNTLAFNKLANANKFYAFFICRLFVVYLLPLIIKVLYWYFSIYFAVQRHTHIYKYRHACTHTATKYGKQL